MRLKLPEFTGVAEFKRRFNDDVWQQAAARICARHGLADAKLRRSPEGEQVIFFVDEKLVVKIYASLRDNYRRELAALEFARGKPDIETPEVLHTGEVEGWPYILMTRVAGRASRELWASIEARNRLEIVSSLGVALKKLHAYPAPLSQPALDRDWRGFTKRQACSSVERQRACGANPEWLERLPAYIDARLDLLPERFRAVLLHGDVHAGNLLLDEEDGHWRIAGLIDFGDSLCGFHEYEFVAPGVLMMQGNRELQRAFLLAYGYKEAELDSDLRARLMLLTILYECSDLRKYALRLAPEAVHLTLDELEAAIWTFATN